MRIGGAGSGATTAWAILAEAWPASYPWAVAHDEQWKYLELPNMPGSPSTTLQVEDE